MLAVGKSSVRSYYKNKGNTNIPSTSENAVTIQSNLVYRFVQKEDYYGDGRQEQERERVSQATIQDHLQSSSGCWWSRTFSFSTVPFLFFGFPSHYLLQNCSTYFKVSVDTKSWVASIFRNGLSCSSIVSFMLLFPTAFMNTYTFYKFASVIYSLFITAQYDTTLVQNLIQCFKYLVIVIPLDYTWLHGYKIQNMIREWNILHMKYHGVGCKTYNFRYRLAFVLFLIGVVFVIRCLTQLKYKLRSPGMSITETVESIITDIVELGHFLTLPIYVTFCYAVKFHFLVMKALIYQWLRDKVTPSLIHLSMVKTLYTQVADNILQINGWFYFYMSIVMPTIMLEAIGGSKITFASMFIPSNVNPFLIIMAKLKDGDGNFPSSNSDAQSSSRSTEAEIEEMQFKVREFNLQNLGILLMVALVYWTIWQALNTNDYARELNLWLNDFVTGGAGVDVQNTLKELGVTVKETNNDEDDTNLRFVSTIKHDILSKQDGGCSWDEEASTSNWAGTNESDGDFLEKFKLLKAYIHVRMELENAALLNIAFVSMLKPNLSGRLTRYRVVF